MKSREQRLEDALRCLRDHFAQDYDLSVKTIIDDALEPTLVEKAQEALVCLKNAYPTGSLNMTGCLGMVRVVLEQMIKEAADEEA